MPVATNAIRKGEPGSPILVTDRGHLDAELLVQLAARGLLVGLAGLLLAARKLPEPAMALVHGPLADEERVPAAHDGGEDAGRMVGGHASRKTVTA